MTAKSRDTCWLNASQLNRIHISASIYMLHDTIDSLWTYDKIQSGMIIEEKSLNKIVSLQRVNCIEGNFIHSWLGVIGEMLKLETSKNRHFWHRSNRFKRVRGPQVDSELHDCEDDKQDTNRLRVDNSFNESKGLVMSTVLGVTNFVIHPRSNTTIWINNCTPNAKIAGALILKWDLLMVEEGRA